MQTKITINGLKNRDDAEKLTQQGNDVAGVRFINVNVDAGYAVITHSEEFDEAAFKAAVTTAGFTPA